MRLSMLAAGALVAIAPTHTIRADDVKPPEGFTALFNGKDLAGWKPNVKTAVWKVDGGAIVVEGGGGGYLMTEREYGDYELRVEYKMSKGANSGVALRTPMTGDPAYLGMEIQLIDDEGWPGKLADYQHTGSIYDVVPASKTNNKPVGEWNSLKIVCKGSKVKIEVNGAVVVDADISTATDDKRKKHPGLTRDKGHIGFQSYNTRVEFRNVVIKEMK